MVKSRFIHLRVHSDYSIIDGLAKIKSLITKVVEFGMPALAITDFTNFYGLIKFYNIANSFGIKPIIGVDFYLENELFSNKITYLTILAKNNKGYHNLILLISAAYKKGYNSIGPTIKEEWLIKYKEGLLLLYSTYNSNLGNALLNKNKYLSEQLLDFYQKYFSGNYYLEITRIGLPNEESYLNVIVNFALQKNIPVVATNNVRFINSNDFYAHEIRVAIHNSLILSNIKKFKKYTPQQYLRSEEEMVNLFLDIPEVLENSIQIAKRCNVIIRLGEYFLPQFPTGKMSTKDFLIQKAKFGLNERLEFIFPDKEDRCKKRFEYDQRLNIELQVINKMGFPGYFLIVMEFIQWAKNNAILVGPGRGSGAGSLVAYALKITDLDPLKFDLLFERFLNLERISMPDFDIDFCMEKRDKVIEHVTQMYGREAVSQIITFGTMTAKAVIRDVGRVLGYSYVFVDRIAKLIPLDLGITLDKALIIEPQLQKIYNIDEEVKILIDMSRKLEGVIRNASKHAGGLVISPTKITDFTPIYCDSKGQNQLTQFDKNDIEYAGLVKFDFLGLRTLTIIRLTLDMINQHLIKKKLKVINISNISLNDKKCFKLLQCSETTAIFQLESRGMKDLIKRLQPDCFEDLIALVALFRPGPLQSGMVDNFINRKHKKEIISYPDIKWQHELIQPVLESTYGIILYQEQVMKIAQVFAGYTLGEADILRRAMGQKKPEEMAKQRLIFQLGASKKGIDSNLSMKIFDLVEKFAGYGFNKSHSAAYALISYQTIWLKTYYPAEFMAAVMTADIDNTDKIVTLVYECWRMKLKILPPDINSGLYNFHVNKNGEIIYGIGAIKGIGESIIKLIISSRKKNGYFKEIFDFCARVNITKINRRVIERLIMSGAFDNLGPHRAALMFSLKDAIKASSQNYKAKIIGQIDMFGLLIPDSNQVKLYYSNIDEWSERFRLEGERETLGFYLTGHPITSYLSEIKYYTNGLRLKDIKQITKGQNLIVAGLVITIKRLITKRGSKICICTLDDRSELLDIILFSNILEKYEYIIKKDEILIAKGYISFDNFSNSNKIIVNEIMNLNQARNKYISNVCILLNNEQINDKQLNYLRIILKSYSSGIIPINIYHCNKDSCTKLKLIETWLVTLTNNLLIKLRSFIGNDQVHLIFYK